MCMIFYVGGLDTLQDTTAKFAYICSFCTVLQMLFTVQLLYI